MGAAPKYLRDALSFSSSFQQYMTGHKPIVDCEKKIMTENRPFV